MLSPRHYAVAGLGYGDEGKGTIVDWLCSREPIHTVVRYNGGAQAAHNVVLPDGRSHTFAQFGSGTLQGARTYLSEHMLINPLALMPEADHLTELGVTDPYSLLTVHEDALITTPFHLAANRARERARAKRHGSCGMGIGETASYAIDNPDGAIRVRDARDRHLLAGKLALMRDEMRSWGASFEWELAQVCQETITEMVDIYQGLFCSRIRVCRSDYLDNIMARHYVVFEGAQGVLLDEKHGFHPYTTWSDTTFGNAMQLASSCLKQPPLKIGVTRTYMTRHGPGPMVTEDGSLSLPEPHNGEGLWQGAVRQGHLDLPALRYAIEVCGGVDTLAVTHADTAEARSGELKVCSTYTLNPSSGISVNSPSGWGINAEDRTKFLFQAHPVYDGRISSDWPELIGSLLGLPVMVVSHGPTFKDKTEVIGAAPESTR